MLSLKYCKPKSILVKKKTLFLLSFCLIVSASVFAQTAPKKGCIGISVPAILSNSEAFYYELGSAKHSTGTAISYGLNINYTQPFLKNFYARVAAGYFRQTFKLTRPFEYHTSDGTKPLYHTKKYSYDNIYSAIAVGYKRLLNKQYSINADISYNHLNSFHQKYFALENNSSQENKDSFSPGHFMALNIGSERVLGNKLSVGFNICMPFYTKWNNDETFYEYEYSESSQQIAKQKFAFGVGVACFYHL